MRKKVSAVLHIVDSYLKKEVKKNDIMIYVDDNHYKYIFKPEGYYVLIDLEVGLRKIKICSERFVEEIFELEIKDEESINKVEQKIIHVFLKPSDKYSFDSNATIISGRFADKKIIDKELEVLMIPKSNLSTIKISEDKAKKGQRNIKLFVPKNARVINNSFVFDNVAEGIFEVCEPISITSEDSVYTLKEDLKNALQRGNELKEAIRVRVNEKGEFFTAINGLFDETVDIEVLIKEKKDIKRKVITVKSNNRNNVEIA